MCWVCLKAHSLTAAIHMFKIRESLTPVIWTATRLSVSKKKEKKKKKNHSTYIGSDLIYTIYIHVYTVHTANQCTDGGDTYVRCQ